MGLLGAERTLKDSIHGIYPVKLESSLKIDGTPADHPAGQAGR